MLMDIFQGSFKDSTEGTKDYRYFASFYLIIRVVVYLAFSMFGYSQLLALPVAVLFGTFLFISYCRPYKIPLFNVLDSIFIILVITVSLVGFSSQLNGNGRGSISETAKIFPYVSVTILVLYLPCLILYTVYSRSVRLQAITQQIKTLFSRHSGRPLLQY